VGQQSGATKWGNKVPQQTACTAKICAAPLGARAAGRRSTRAERFQTVIALWLSDTALRAAAQPNSFVYRYLPNNPARLEDGGKLQALQVSFDGQPLTFGGTANAAADIIAPAQKEAAHAWRHGRSSG
jgi:hypothetical protein